MPVISGVVLAGTTGQGLGDLVVSLYTQSAPSVAEQPDTHIAPAITHRLGSTLTDDDGRFSLSLAEQAREANGTLSILKVVVSIQHCVDETPCDDHDGALCVQQISNYAGTNEAVAVHVPLERLRQAGLTSMRDASNASSYVETVRESWAFEDDVNQSLQQDVQNKHSLVDAQRQNAQRLFTNLSAVASDSTSGRSLFVAQRSSHVEAQSTAIDRGVQRLANHRTGLRLSLGTEDLARLNALSGPDIQSLKTENGRVVGEVDASALFHLVSERAGGTTLTRTQSLLAACVPLGRDVPGEANELLPPAVLVPQSKTVVRLVPGEVVELSFRLETERGQPVSGVDVQFEAAETHGVVSPMRVRTNADGQARTRWRMGDAQEEQRLTASAQGVTTVNVIAKVSADATDVTTEEAEEQLLSRTIGQVQPLREAESVHTLPARPDQARVQEAINRLQLTGGPADTTAFHDFHVLQVAFEHVWTEAFSGKLLTSAKRLYEEWVEVRQENGLDIPAQDAVETIYDEPRPTLRRASSRS
ncbi:MAG: hypothetical protein AAFO89_05765, partial [Planctomycetota bacterium]